MEACFGVDLSGRDPLVAEELLHLVQWHARVKQNRRDARSQAVRGDVLVDARTLRGVLDQPLNVSRGVLVRAVAFEDVAAPPAAEVRAQLLRQNRQNWDVAIAAALGFADVDLRRIERQVQVLNPELNELAHASTGIEQHFHHEPILAGMVVGTFDQALDLDAVQSFHGSTTLSWGLDAEFAAGLFNHMLGLVIGQVMLPPKLGRLPGDLGQRVRSMLILRT